MRYAIETLEIEIAELKKKIRNASGVNWTHKDYMDGSRADTSGMYMLINELEKAIDILKKIIEEEQKELELMAEEISKKRRAQKEE